MICRIFRLKINMQYFGLLVFIVLPVWMAAQVRMQEQSFLLIRNTNVADVLSGRILPGRDVVIKGEKIYFVGKSFTGKIPFNSVVINGEGKYVCPALWDMHFHLCWDSQNDTLLFPALLKNGISGIRDMGGDLKIMNAFKNSPQKNKPFIYGAGPMIDGNPPVYTDFSLPVDTNTNMTAVLDSLKENGSDFFKTYSLVKETELKSIAAYCRKNKMQFAGHLSEYIDPEVSISSGQRSIEHLNRLDNIWDTNKKRLNNIAGLMIKNKTFLCPTLITYQLKTKLRDSSIINEHYSRYIPASLKREWQQAWEKRKATHIKLADWEELDKTFQSQLKLVAHLNKKGVVILAGSDFGGMPYVYPGAGLHQELKLLVEAGLSDYEAVKTATINPAIFISKQQLYGSVSKGKYADILILEKNPFDNIDNLQTITWVIIKGKAYNNNW